MAVRPVPLARFLLNLSFFLSFFLFFPHDLFLIFCVLSFFLPPSSFLVLCPVFFPRSCISSFFALSRSVLRLHRTLWFVGCIGAGVFSLALRLPFPMLDQPLPLSYGRRPTTAHIFFLWLFLYTWHNHATVSKCVPSDTCTSSVLLIHLPGHQPGTTALAKVKRP